MSSLKRFEQKGLIALDSLLRLARVLDCLFDFDRVGADEKDDLASTSLDKLPRQPKVRRKGRLT